MEKIVLFKNWTDEDFTCTWNKVPHSFKAGESRHMEDWKAEHFANHLADRELIRSGKETIDPSKPALIQKALSGGEEVVKEKMVSELAEKNVENVEKVVEKEEEEFPDLKKDETPKETAGQGSKK